MEHTTTGGGTGIVQPEPVAVPAPEELLKMKASEPVQLSVPSMGRDSEDGSEPAPVKSKKSLSFHLAFLGLSLLLLVFQMDATGLSVALPAIAAELNGTSLEAFWANLSYSLCGLVMQPIWASISDAFGRKYPLHASVFLFFIGSIVFAVAQDMNTVIAGRVLQGLGGGGIDVLTTVVLADMTALEERSKYLGLMAVATAVGNIMGPFVGALFSQYSSWRWIGWINLPLLGLGAVLLFFFLRLKAVPLGATLKSNLIRLDWIGMPLGIVGVAFFCVAISWAGSLFPWASWQTLLPLLGGLAILAIFTWYESKPAAPLIPLHLFQNKTGNVAMIGGFIHGMILISLLQYLPLLYQAVQLKTAVQSAVLLLPTLILSVLITVVSMMMVPIFGGYVWLIRISWVIATLGTGLLALYQTNSSSSMLFGLPILWGQGVSLLRLLMLPVQASVKNVNDEGLASATFITIRMFGSLVGLAICSPIFNDVFAKSVSGTTIDLTGPLAPLQDSANAINFIDQLRSLQLPTATRDQVSGLYLNSFRAIFYTMTALSALGLVTSIFLDELELKRKERGNQAFEHKNRQDNTQD